MTVLCQTAAPVSVFFTILVEKHRPELEREILKQHHIKEADGELNIITGVMRIVPQLDQTDHTLLSIAKQWIFV